jgi:FKBP12-rapamycin complex-associated protein
MSRELSGQELKRFYDEVNNIIKNHVQSPEINDKLCGVMIIGTFLADLVHGVYSCPY